MKLPSIEEAENLITIANKLNPGKWFYHSYNTAKAAYTIAEKLPNVDPCFAYILGLLHDIGRREGNYKMRHTIDGYKYLISLGYDDAARICITHLYPYKNHNATIGEWDCTDEEVAFVRNYLDNVEYTIYEKIIQFSDHISLDNGYSLLEKRFIDIALRYGVDKYSILRWKELLGIKKELDKALNCSVYSLFPNIERDTFCIEIF